MALFLINLSWRNPFRLRTITSTFTILHRQVAAVSVYSERCKLQSFKEILYKSSFFYYLQIGSRSSVYSPESRVRKTGSFIYEDFMPTDGMYSYSHENVFFSSEIPKKECTNFLLKRLAHRTHLIL